uniref:Uncharacterized protein n=1 Tax=Rhizophora mucronata TaxID=61149 RepID=A0A2P2NA33_RHIMU
MTNTLNIPYSRSGPKLSNDSVKLLDVTGHIYHTN